ncbi:MAG: hypothetical protein JWR60_4111 [Polaromonas sp.]|nr:hypothetical protein [Polaromonas sp.]
MVLPLELELPSPLAGMPPLVLTWGGVTGTVPPPGPVLAAEPVGSLGLVDATPLLEAPGDMLPEEGPPEVSGTGATPAAPVLLPPRASGAAGVATSVPVLGLPASVRPLELVPEPTAAGELPGLDSLRLSQPASDRAANMMQADTRAKLEARFASGNSTRE